MLPIAKPSICTQSGALTIVSSIAIMLPNEKHAIANPVVQISITIKIRVNANQICQGSIICVFSYSLCEQLFPMPGVQVELVPRQSEHAQVLKLRRIRYLQYPRLSMA